MKFDWITCRVDGVVHAFGGRKSLCHVRTRPRASALGDLVDENTKTPRTLCIKCKREEKWHASMKVRLGGVPLSFKT